MGARAHVGQGPGKPGINVPAAWVAPITSSPKSTGQAPELEGTGLKKGAREMLRELAARPISMTRRHLATRVIMAHSGGSFSDYLSALRSAGFIEDDANGDVIVTAAGLKAAGAVSAKSSGEIAALWKSRGKFAAGHALFLGEL